MEWFEIYLNTVDSTQTYAKQHRGSFDPKKLTCISAEEQSKGRGRFQRTWLSPKGVNLYVTFYFQLPLNQLHLVSLAQVLTYCFAKILIRERFLPKIKWPNDIQLNGKKVSGTLCETSYHKEYVEIFLGIGINVNMEKGDLDKIDQPAASLKSETGKTWDKKLLLKKLQEEFALDLEVFKRKGFAPFHAPFENLLAYKGQKISCFDGRKVWEGICHSLTYDGQLNLLLPDQKIVAILSGEIIES